MAIHYMFPKYVLKRRHNKYFPSSETENSISDQSVFITGDELTMEIEALLLQGGSALCDFILLMTPVG